MTKTSFRRGAVLLTALVVTAVVAILLGGVFAYVSGMTRFAARAIGDDLCRLAAQSEIELAKGAVYDAFQHSPRMRGAKTIVGGAFADSSTSVFDWFGSYSGATPRLWIGADPTVRFASVPTGLGGCTVRVGVGRIVHATGDQFADVTFVAEATRANPGGGISRVTLAETVRFAQQRSKVFDNAYFVNNYGWFQGSGCTANGDVRANGNMYLDSSCKINGRVYASRNEELGVDGNVTNYGKMDAYGTYRTGSYGTANRARPLSSDPVTKETNEGGFKTPNSVTTQDLRERIKANQPLSVEMPYIGDISSADSDYLAWAQELHRQDATKCTIRQGGRTLVSVYHDAAGPSGQTLVKDAYGNEVQAPDYGAIVLTGTKANPIEISGPVIVPNDVIISGYVKGQGTIYSGRNIHIVGNIQYVDPPVWTGKSSSGGSNAAKDMLGLMAKGNIVMGDYTQSSWLSSIKTYLSQEPYVQRYACDTSDAAIGYPATFGGSYATTEQVATSDYDNCRNSHLADFTPGGYDRRTGRFGKMTQKTVTLDTYHTERQWVANRWGGGGSYQDVKVYDTATVYETEYSRKYYESVCLPEEITSRASTITQVDAVLYNNHGIFGKLGACSINGALVCRNEGLQYSGSLFLNWDIRLYSGSRETVDNDNVGLAKASDNTPVTREWMQLPQGLVVFPDPEGR